jgi:hypothetical protein
MKIAIAQHVTSFESLDRQINYEAISDDPENYQRCIARERILEIEACRNSGVPHFLILDTPETRGIRLAGEGGQNPFRQHLLYDADRNPVESPAGYEVLVRAHVGVEQSLLAFVEAKHGTNVADWDSQELTLEWYKHVRPEYLKRKVAWFPMESIYSEDLSPFMDKQGRFFCKTNHKTRGYAGVTNNLVAFLGYQSQIMPLSTEVIVSEPLDILMDAKSKLEYRCYVVRGSVSSISRYRDYDIDYAIPREIEEFAEAFAADHQATLPGCYVLDLAASDRGLVVIELNGIVASGRHEKNCFSKLLLDLVA